MPSFRPWSAGRPLRSLDDLARFVIFHTDDDPDGLNFYDGAHKIATEADPDQWTDQVQLFKPVAGSLNWEHGSALNPVLCVRIPYMIRPESLAAPVLEHLLVGYLTRTATAATPDGQWRPRPENIRSDLQRLGDMLVRRFNPENRSRPMQNWKTSISPVVGRRSWDFRGVPRNIEKSLLIPYAVPSGANHVRAEFLVGYEGGGAY